MEAKALDWGAIDVIVTDSDGVLTDDRVWVDADGHEALAFCKGDSVLSDDLLRVGVPTIVMTQEKNEAILRRCEKLGWERQYVEDRHRLAKWDALLRLAERRACVGRRSTMEEIRHVCYVGNDLADIACIDGAGIGAVPADACPGALLAADYVCRACGGHGVLREIGSLILAGKGYAHEK